MKRSHGLHRPDLEHAGCGAGFVVDVSGRPGFEALNVALGCAGKSTPGDARIRR